VNITISVSDGIEYFEPIQIDSLEHLAAITTQFNYTLGTFKDGKRNLASFLKAEAIGIDVDNDGSHKMTLKEAIEAFKPYKHVIMTTKSHQKEKNGTVRDRFRVILFLTEPITDKETFTATWQSLHEKFPAIDPACKDASRYWAPGPNVITIQATGLTIDPQAPKPRPEPKKPIAVDGVKGALRNSTLNFLLNGTNKGGRNNNVYKAAKDFLNKGYDIDEAITKISTAFENIGLYDDDFTEREVITTVSSAFKGEPMPTYDYAPNKELEALLYEGQLVINFEDPAESVLVVKEKGITVSIHKTAVKEVLGNSKTVFNTYIQTHSVHAQFDYDKKSGRILFRDPKMNTWIYNCYTPPKWQEKAFYFGEKLAETPKDVPQLYTHFFKHLTNNDGPSYEYLLDWLATAMQSRNYTILCAIGDQGVGKGILGSIMEKLVGEANFVRTRDEIFKNKFNGQLKNKVLVYIDEVKLKTIEDHNRLKDIVNDKIEVEAKGQDAKYITNHASYYLSSNQFDAVKPEAGDRRFSILELTDRKLTETPLIEQVNELTEDKNIEQLALYLLKREVKHNMLTPFYSKRSDEVKEASLADWEAFVVFTWTQKNLGKEINLKNLQDDVAKEFGFKNAPGRARFEGLARKYPEYLKITRPDPKSGDRLVKVVDSPTKVVPLKERIKTPVIS
jgi:hypothetical protein